MNAREKLSRSDLGRSGSGLFGSEALGLGARGWLLVGMGVCLVLGAGLLLGLPSRLEVRVLVAGSQYAVKPSGQNLPETLNLIAAKFREREVTVQAAEFSTELSRQHLGLGVDRARLDQTLREELRRLWDKPRSAGARLAQSLEWLRGEPGGHLEITAALPLTLDTSVAKTTVAELARLIHRYPEDAELVIEEHRIIKSQPGRALSVDAALERLARVEPEEAFLELEVEELPPGVTEEELLPVDITRVLATFETSFRGKAGPRAVNIRTAARFLNGAVILPGEVLSFNSRVGRRIHGRGFVDAPVIVNDEMDEDVGGGVCQVATTLHAAAVYGNLEVLERRSHSRPSGYAPIGLDATVIDGKVDLRLRNPYEEPLLVHAWVPEPYLIRVELLGRAPDVQVEHSAVVTATEPFSRRVWHKPEAGVDGFKQKQKGSPGMDVVSVLVVRREGEELTRRSYPSKYYPVPEVFYVGERFFTANLPAMPDGAVGLVIDGEEVAKTAALSPDPPRDMNAAPTIDESNGITRDSTARPD